MYFSESGTQYECKPAVFLDRDGVINMDFGHVGDPSRIVYIEGALQSIRLLNELGFRVFIVTNQAGIGKGLYSEEDYLSCMKVITADLKEIGGFYDDVRFCPYHADSVIEKYRIDNHFWRKPNPGMIIDLLEKWPTQVKGSLIIGDKESDMVAGRLAGLNGYLFDQKDNLLSFIKKIPEIRKKLNFTEGKF